MISINHKIKERTKIIPINKNLSTQINKTKMTNEYNLHNTFFDPSKSSPPNEFIIKLKKRILVYNSNYYADTKVDNLDSE